MRVTVLLAVLAAGCIGFNSRQAGDRAGLQAVDGLMAGSGDRARSVDADGNGRDGVAELQPTWKTIGYSWQGRPLRVTRIGRGLRRVLWIGGIHGDEREGRVGTEELPQAVRAMPGMTDDITLILLEDANPDGSANGTRGNARGVDLNRNYPAPNFRSNRFFGMRPLDQPEARAIHDLVLGERPDLVIVAHSWRNDHFINYDGPAVRLAERFAELSGYRVKESDDIAPTPGSLGSWIGKTLGIPILTLEYRRGRDSRSAWSETRGAILAVMRAG